MCDHIFPSQVKERYPISGWDYILYTCSECNEDVGAQVSPNLYSELD